MALKVKFSQATPVLTIKSSAAATSLGTLADIDNNTADAGESGATLVYDSTSGTYKNEKVFEYDGTTVTMKGGEF